MRRRGARLLGPYEQHNGWRVVEVDELGGRSSVLFPTEEKGRRYIEMMEAELNREEHTTVTALAQYKTYLREKGNRERSIETTVGAIESFFPDSAPLALLSAKRCTALYDALRTRPTRTGKAPSADTHHNALGQVRTFLAWCVSRGWLRENPATEIKGIGKRRPRGLSLGKHGHELKVRQARAWYELALFKAHQGDDGAIAALVALLLGLRASEIISRRVNDLDEDRAAGDLLWIPCSKTAAGRRTLEVPEVLRELLVRCTTGKAPERYLFESEPGEPHWRDWPRKNIRRICKLAEVPEVTAHAMRGLLATLTAERGLAGHLIAATLGHEDERTTMRAYAAPGSAATGVNRKGLEILNGEATYPLKVAK